MAAAEETDPMELTEFKDSRVYSHEKPSDLWGHPFTSELETALERTGIKIEATYDDFADGDYGFFVRVIAGTPAFRILQAVERGELDRDVATVFRSVTDDIEREQFEKNWAEFLESPTGQQG